MSMLIVLVYIQTFFYDMIQFLMIDFLFIWIKIWINQNADWYKGTMGPPRTKMFSFMEDDCMQSENGNAR